MERPIIEINSVSKRYRLGAIGATRLKDDLEALWRRLRGQSEKRDERDFWALRDVSLDVYAGEVLGIIGRNGAEKARCSSFCPASPGPPGAGRMRGSVGSLLEVGTGFHPELTGRENIFLNGAILGMSRQEIAA